jgi:hypothetical protein
MTVQVTQVRFDVDDRDVTSSVKSIDGELEQLQRKAQETVRQARQARQEASGVGGGALQRRARGELKGAVTQSITAGGIVRGGLRTAGITRAIPALVATHAVGQGLRALTNLRDMTDSAAARGISTDEALREMGGSAARSVVERIGGMTGITEIGRSIHALVSGRTSEESQQDVQEFFDRMFTTREELARREQAERQDRQRAEAEIEAARQEALGNLAVALPENIRLQTADDVKLFRKVFQTAQRPDGLTNLEVLNRRANALRREQGLTETEGR